ncbi:MAG: SIS domain-containing protein [Clostridia bacterium]|nr:SIS domain-containing protein [Clostridia bacterium]
MKPSAYAILENLMARYPALECCRDAVFAAGEMLVTCYRDGGKLLICGNGGSCADGQHIVGELMKAFILPRTVSDADAKVLHSLDPEHGAFIAERLQGALPAISLSGETALMTAYINDVNADMVFAQQVWGYGRAGDVLLALSTSGRSKNVVLACTAAKARNMRVIGMTGAEGRDVGARSDVLIAVPAREAYLVQELHLPVWHALCLMLEEEFFGRA